MSASSSPLSLDILQILETGLALTLQDRGRPGWRKFGVPPGGAMDDHAATWANRLLDNSPSAPVLELLLQGARFVALRDVWVAITGAPADGSLPLWRAVAIRAGNHIEFPGSRSGVWSYLAVEGGFAATPLLGSASTWPRGVPDSAPQRGDVLSAAVHRPFRLPDGVAGRVAPTSEQRHYEAPPTLRVWPGPQAPLFSAGDHDRFFRNPWTISSRSDRVGYRLNGVPLESRPPQLLSEPLRVGTVQVPENGLPIVTMRDGPTVGGYPKFGMIEPADLSWLAQCRPGQTIRFKPAHES